MSTKPPPPTPPPSPDVNIEVMNGFFNVVAGKYSYGFRACDLKSWNYDVNQDSFIIMTTTQRIVLLDYKNVLSKQFVDKVKLCYPVVNINLGNP